MTYVPPPAGPAPATAPAASPTLSTGLVWLMAATCALVVANIYYNQPLLGEISRAFDVPESQASLVATVTQLGYTLCMLLIVPLGDLLERKRLIVLMQIGAALCMAAAAWAPSFGVLLGASLLIGVCSAVPQLLLPLAAHLAPPEARGRIVGQIMSGLLIGILLSRTVSGYVGAHLGWRMVFGGGAGLMVVLAAVLATQLPRSLPTFRGSYAALMASILTLTRTQPMLRRSALVGGCMFASFSVFWTTLVFLLESPPYHYGADVAGLFGLIGACGALAAPLAGRSADTHGPDFAIRLGAGLGILAFGILLPGSSYLAALVVGVILLDVGVQSAHIANQSRIFALLPEARSRLNTVYMTGYFIGGALGSLAGGWAWTHAGWPGVCAVGFAFTILAWLISRFYGHERASG